MGNLLGRLTGERQNCDPVGRYPLMNQILRPSNNRARFARACTRQNQEMLPPVLRGTPLLIVQ